MQKQHRFIPLFAAGLLICAGGAHAADEDAHISGHKTGRNATAGINALRRSSAPMPGHRTTASPRRTSGNSRAMARSQASTRMGGASTRGRQQAGSMDRMFMMKAAHINIGEVKGGQLALTRAVNAGVRDYAQMMISGHSRANMQLKRLAARERVNLPNDTDMKHKALANRLAKLSGSPFDRAYMAAMVKGHQDAIALFQKQASSGRDPEVRRWAASMIPSLQQHLQAARQLAGSRAVRTGAKMAPGEDAGMNMNGGGQGGTGAGNDDHAGHGHDTDQGGTDQGGSDQGGSDE